eukprot:gene4881-8475_t
MLNSSEISKVLKIEEEDILAIYTYGSHVYGTNTKQSDWDYCVVVKDKIKVPSSTIEFKSIDFNLHNESKFKKDIQDHFMPVIENIFTTSKLKYEKIEYSKYFELDKAQLRIGVSSISSKCFHYAKILWNKENDLHKSKKNVFHSIRYLMEGIQILKEGKIIDYTVANDVFYDLMNTEFEDFSEIKKKWMPKIKELNQQLFELVPKELLKNK